MSTVIEIEHYAYDFDESDFSYTVTKKLEIDDLESNLMQCIRKLSDEDLTVFFDEYYPNFYTDITFEHCFPYILKHGKYEWHVPIEDVTVKDFVLTHDIHEGETIRLREGGIGGGDFDQYVSAIVYWIPIVLTNIGMISTAGAIYKKVMPLYNKLIGKNNKVASPYEFLELLKGKDAWTVKDLQNRTTIDEKTIEFMLIYAGFEKQGNKYLRIQTEGKEESAVSTSLESMAQELWGDYGDSESVLKDLLDTVHDLNLGLTSLKFQSEYNESECFDIIMAIVDYHVESWSGYLLRGRGLRFVELVEDIGCINEDILQSLAYSTACLAGYAAHLCELLDERKIIERRSTAQKR